MSEQNGATALVTGANRGIGREVARQLAERGYQLLVTARDGEQASAAADRIAGETGASVRSLVLDVSDRQSIEAAAASVSTDPGRLDVLVNNAGVGLDFGVSGTAPDFDAIEQTLQTNFYGAYRLTIALLDLLRASAHPRIVNVSSGMGGVAGWADGRPVTACPRRRSTPSRASSRRS